MRSLRIQCFGELEVRYGDARVEGFESQKVRALLTYMTCHLDRSLSRDHLATLLWPEKSEDAARGNLRQALYNIRSLFPDDVEPILSSRQDLRINEELHCWVDVLAFDDALDRNDEVENVDTHLLTEAAGLYRGDFLAGFHVKGSSDFDFWLLSEQERLRERAIVALRRLIESYLSRGAFRLGIQYAQKLVSLDPMSEEAHRQLMQLFALSGRRGRALAQYAELEGTLKRELGVEPLEETRELRQSILNDEVALNVADAHEEGIGPLIPLVHRRKEFETLRSCMNAALGGDAVLTLIEGEAGVGKSRLMKSFMDAVSSAQTIVLKGRCFDEVPALLEPFSKVIRNAFDSDSELVRSVLGESEDILAPLALLNPLAEADSAHSPRFSSVGKTRKSIFDAVGTFLSRLAGPCGEDDSTTLILMLDDFEFADPAAVDLLRHLEDRLKDRKAWIVAAYNPDAIDSGHPVRQLADRLRQKHSDHYLSLTRLPSESFEEISSSLIGVHQAPLLARFLERNASGLPLEIVEWINFLWDEGVLVSDFGRWRLANGLDEVDAKLEDVHELVLRRIRRLPSSTKRVASLAALAGPNFEADLVTNAADEHNAVVDIGLELLLERWMIRRFTDHWLPGRRERDLVLWSQGARRGQFEFSSKLIRRAICNQIDPRRRKVIHESIGITLERMHEIDLDDFAELLAYHFGQAENHGKAWKYQLHAGDKARNVAAYTTARDYYEAALHHLEKLRASKHAGKKTWATEVKTVQARLKKLG